LPRSVVARTTLGILLLAAVMGVIFAVMASWRVRNAEQDRLIARVHELSATVESTASVACFLQDKTLAKEITTGLMKNRILSGVRIRSGDQVLYQAGGRAPAKGLSRGAVDEISRTIHSPFDPTAVVGEITMFVSHAEIEAQAIAYSRYTTWMLGLQLAIVAGGVALLVYLLITRPIKGISDELKWLGVRAGMRLTVPSFHRSDEIGQLIVNVNSLITRLTDAVATERDLRKAHEVSERRMRLVLEKADTGILVLDENGTVLSCNPSFTRILGGTDTATTGASLAALLAPHGPLVAGLIAESFESGQPRDADLEIEARGRGKVWVELSVNPLGPNLLQGLVNDITERKRAECAAHELAMRDSITGLLNRRGLDGALNAALASVSESKQLALLLVDLDYFKAVNDTFGHAAGDLVLREVANVLAQCVRRTDIVGRSGGDEFVVLLPGIEGAYKAEEIAANIIAGLHKPIAVGDGKFAHVGASIGIALTGPTREPAAELMRRADVAMYAAKQAGRGRAFLRHQSGPPSEDGPRRTAVA
jgi:diguanylate cyclase (GGDEF)-like protein/PAS domain S-box-containing protein